MATPEEIATALADVAEGTELTLRLRDGQEIRGRFAGVDDRQVHVEDADGPDPDLAEIERIIEEVVLDGPE